MIITASACGAGGNNAKDTVIRVAALKGPTTIGLVNLMDDAANGNTDYQPHPEHEPSAGFYLRQI
jgi:hypothetical protein